MDGRRFIAAALGINPTDMAETPLLARALPVRALLEEAARLEGAPLREDVDLLAPPPLPEESAPSEPQGGSSQDQTSPSGGIEEDPFFTNAIGQTKPLILVLAALGALAIIGAIVTGITALLIFINKWRMKSRPRGR